MLGGRVLVRVTTVLWWGDGRRRRRRRQGDVWNFLVAAAKKGNGSALQRLEPESIKQLLLQHARACRNSRCKTCEKLRNRVASVKRKRHLWQEWVFKNTLVFVGQVRVCLTW